MLKIKEQELQTLIKYQAGNICYASKSENSLRPNYLKAQAERLIELLDKYLLEFPGKDYNGE